MKIVLQSDGQWLKFENEAWKTIVWHVESSDGVAVICSMAFMHSCDYPPWSSDTAPPDSRVSVHATKISDRAIGRGLAWQDGSVDRKGKQSIIVLSKFMRRRSLKQ